MILNMENEIWKDIKGYEGLYQVSNNARVKSVARFNGKMTVYEKIKKQSTGSSGYLFVMLYKENIGKNNSVHRLVAEAFIPNPDNKPQVNHIDGNKKNNQICNLEWCTRKENTQHAIRTGLNKLYNNRCLDDEDILSIVRAITYYKYDVKFISCLYDVSFQTVYGILSGKQWKRVTGL
jgi:hypothetical protein